MKQLRIFLLSVSVIFALIASGQRTNGYPARDDRNAIEQLHQLDIDATLSDKADELAKLWDSDAVRIQPGRAAEVGKSVIYDNDKHWEASADQIGRASCRERV